MDRTEVPPGKDLGPETMEGTWDQRPRGTPSGQTERQTPVKTRTKYVGGNKMLPPGRIESGTYYVLL